MHRPATAATTAAPRTFEAIALKQISNYVNTAVMSPHSWKGGIDAFNAAELRIALGKKNSSAEEQTRVISRIIKWLSVIAGVHWQADRLSPTLASFPLKTVYEKIKGMQDQGRGDAEFFYNIDIFLRDLFDWLRAAYEAVRTALAQNGLVWIARLHRRSIARWQTPIGHLRNRRRHNIEFHHLYFVSYS